MNRPKNIFLIEDDEHDQYFFTHIIESMMGVTVQDIASDGKEALKKLRQSQIRPDIIFTDLQMPGMDGVDCIAAIKKIDELRDIPIVVLSTDNTRLELLRKVGARAFIRKTGDLQELESRINGLLHLDYNNIDDASIADQTFRNA